MDEEVEKVKNALGHDPDDAFGLEPGWIWRAIRQSS
jgi:hypothetical protein